MITPVAVNEVMALFTPRERLALRRLRTRYEMDQDRFSARERARLDFVRWLRETGRI